MWMVSYSYENLWNKLKILKSLGVKYIFFINYSNNVRAM